ncbi:MAG: hypothetical protein ACNYNY_00750 [Candidatus Oxydemutatoraceae bacterium WSBS_2016_MAG_OTU14]
MSQAYLTLTRTDGATDTVVGGPVEVDARTADSTTFVDLTAGIIYTPSVVAKGMLVCMLQALSTVSP